MKNKNYDVVEVSYPDERMKVRLKVYPDETLEEAIKRFDLRRAVSLNPMRKNTTHS